MTVYSQNNLLGASFWSPPRVFDQNHPECIDRPDATKEAVHSVLKILEFGNGFLGGHSLILRYIEQAIHPTRTNPLRFLDLGTGAGDIPRAIVDWARAQSMNIEITALDQSPLSLEYAVQKSTHYPEITYVQRDMLHLNLPPESFDVVLCNSTLHHFDFSDAVSLLRRIQSLAKQGYVVFDLRRNWLSVALVRWLAPCLIHHPQAISDTLQSCRAAFSLSEMKQMALQAELSKYRILRHHALFHQVLIGIK